MLVWPLRCPSWRLVRTRESHCLTWLLPFCLHQPSLLGPSVVRVLEGRLLPPGCAPGGGSNPLDLILLDIAPNSLRKVLLKNKRLKQWLFFIVQKHDFFITTNLYHFPPSLYFLQLLPHKFKQTLPLQLLLVVVFQSQQWDSKTTSLDPPFAFLVSVVTPVYMLSAQVWESMKERWEGMQHSSLGSGLSHSV